ncbi:hypothetical protein F5J12DRAFT_834681 [Pisolithus orientalis]|uniref:uncharacterized protein n=1 Tax=Pisolithus orientalis TaxID=936130 RepID=UPI00222415E8|nr:uncharacterized protein F5J12DRAFT_834681 [Pisolithus orientalis]KAI6005095.1 hypothetical protein F5J12DRAFT_834681 [Pisolithus orientalis]
MATTQHYVWAGGHFLLLVSALRYLVAYVTFKTVSPWWYRASFLGALVSYAIVCYKSLGSPQPTGTYIKKALMDENVQYFLLASFWWSSKPVPLALIPFFIFSLFHVLTFTRTTLMPRFLPPGPPATAGGAPQPHPLAKRLQLWVKVNYDKAMRVVAYAELAILVRVVFGAIFFKNSFIAPLVFLHFLRQRYYQSAFTRDAIAVTDARVTELVRRSGNPVVAEVWDKARELFARWAAGPIQAAGATRRD